MCCPAGGEATPDNALFRSPPLMKKATGYLLDAVDRAYATPVAVGFHLPQANGQEADRDTIMKVVNNQLVSRLGTPLQAIFPLSDDLYYLPKDYEVERIWRHSRLRSLAYKIERFDCDDYAFAFKGTCSRYAYIRNDWKRHGIAVGIAAGRFAGTAGNHVVNIFVNAEGKIRFIDAAVGIPMDATFCQQLNALII